MMVKKMIIQKFLDKIKKYSLITGGFVLLSTLAPPAIRADDISKGMRGPTSAQVDLRAQTDLESIVAEVFLKFWDGKECGTWGFMIAPYKFGWGTSDLTVGGGPRWTIGNLHLMPYGSLKIPTGEIGSQRYDEALGLLATYLIGNFEIDLATQYTFTGKDRDSNNPHNSYYFGMVSGGKLASKWKGVIGFTSVRKANGDYSLAFRSVLRFTQSKYIHFELVADADLSRKNMPKKTGLTLCTRINL